MSKKKIFWGTGKLGKEVLSLWRKLNIRPDYFCDNASSLWGSRIEGITVLSPVEVYGWKDRVTVFITCGKYAEIEWQLKENGIPESEIVRADGALSSEMYARISDSLCPYITAGRNGAEKDYKCLIDLSGGMVLGGVERWSYSLAETLNKLQIKSAYIIPGNCIRTIADTAIPAIFVENRRGVPIIDVIEELLHSGADTVVCNFPFEIMIGACVIKKCINPKLKLVAVVHNDEEIYYRALTTWERYIDICLTISSKMKKALIERGFPFSKIRELYWKIPCSEGSRNTYSPLGTPLKIGYAGRISVKQKRADLLLMVGERLRENRMEFCMSIAGAGEYEEELKKQIREKGLDDYIKFLGEIAHEQIAQFWEEQDICISCSEWEGHSISHSEAMAAGAVPVVTDTSGARDDVEEGVNGFVVEIGDMDALAERILYLDQHRGLLYKMGNNSKQKIIARNKYMEAESYWKQLLGTALR